MVNQMPGFLRFIRKRENLKMKHPRWESNPDLQIRSLPFYPLNYGGVRGVIIIDLDAVDGLSYFRHELSSCRSDNWHGDRA